MGPWKVKITAARDMSSPLEDERLTCLTWTTWLGDVALTMEAAHGKKEASRFSSGETIESEFPSATSARKVAVNYLRFFLFFVLYRKVVCRFFNSREEGWRSDSSQLI